ncbi:uncharacterized protein LOC135923351 [Gordionus sp. m RMFG-2023]|uniref:uncharacterized protein LOC135923351 n=1 Tax=Gordionus sp. m RMFG-2023 TaxID=3053472 RepID=UPI0031FC9129
MAFALKNVVFKPTLYNKHKFLYQHIKTDSTTFAKVPKSKKHLYYIAGICGAGVIGLITSLEYSVKAMTKLHLHPAKYPWSHNGFFDSLDMSSVRRGYQVYKQVCAACHSMKFRSYRQMVDAFMTIDEAKAEAAEIQVTDGPDDKGEMFKRPGKLTDTFPDPYPNEQAARAANNGAAPPDLSLIVRAREGNEDYIYAILTGYEEIPPAGVPITETQHYNPYFPGGAISMAQALYDDIFEYEDGTPATVSQLAKDVVTFLRWSSEPHFEERKRRLVKVCLFFPVVILVTYVMYKQKAVLYKTQKYIFKPIPKDKFV